MLLSCSLLPNCISSICESLEIKSSKAALLYGSKVSLLRCCSEDLNPLLDSSSWTPDDRERRTESAVLCADSGKLSFSESPWQHLACRSLRASTTNRINWWPRSHNYKVVWGHLLAILAKHWRKKNPKHLNYLQNIQKLFEFPPPFFFVKDEKKTGFHYKDYELHIQVLRSIYSTICTPLKFLANILKFSKTNCVSGSQLSGIVTAKHMLWGAESGAYHHKHK